MAFAKALAQSRPRGRHSSRGRARPGTPGPPPGRVRLRRGLDGRGPRPVSPIPAQKRPRLSLSDRRSAPRCIRAAAGPPASTRIGRSATRPNSECLTNFHKVQARGRARPPARSPQGPEGHRSGDEDAAPAGAGARAAEGFRAADGRGRVGRLLPAAAQDHQGHDRRTGWPSTLLWTFPPGMVLRPFYICA
jgi:hypothetical protein